jgi:hypothetical protein
VLSSAWILDQPASGAPWGGAASGGRRGGMRSLLSQPSPIRQPRSARVLLARSLYSASAMGVSNAMGAV